MLIFKAGFNGLLFAFLLKFLLPFPKQPFPVSFFASCTLLPCILESKCQLVLFFLVHIYTNGFSMILKIFDNLNNFDSDVN